MVRRQATRTVNIPHTQVWKLLSDLESPSKYHPMVNRVEITSSHNKGIGASRRVHYVDGSTETEEVVQIGQGYIIFKPHSFHESSPGKDFIMTYKVKKLLPDWTEIVLEANYTLRAADGPWRALRSYLSIDPTVRRLHKQLQKVLEGIEYHLTTERMVRKSVGNNVGPTRTSRGKNKVVQQPHVVVVVAAAGTT